MTSLESNQKQNWINKDSCAADRKANFLEKSREKGEDGEEDKEPSYPYIFYLNGSGPFNNLEELKHCVSIHQNIDICIICYSAGKRDRGKKKKKKKKKKKSLGQGGAEGPDAGLSTEEGAEGPRRLGRTQAPLGKKVFYES